MYLYQNLKFCLINLFSQDKYFLMLFPSLLKQKMQQNILQSINEAILRVTGLTDFRKAKAFGKIK